MNKENFEEKKENIHKKKRESRISGQKLELKSMISCKKGNLHDVVNVVNCCLVFSSSTVQQTYSYVLATRIETTAFA